MAELSDIRCVLIDPNTNTEVEKLIYRYYPIFYSGYVNSSNEVIFLAWDNIDKIVKLVEKLTLDIMYFPDMEASKVEQPYLIRKSQLNIPTAWDATPDLSKLGYTKKSSLLYTDYDTIKKTYTKPLDYDTEESYYGAGQGGFAKGLEPYAFYGYETFDIFKTKNEFNKYKIYMNFQKNLNSSLLIHYECTCPTAKSPIIINLSSSDSIVDNDEQNARACAKALDICNNGTCHTNETLPQEKEILGIRECHDINDLMDAGYKIPCESTLSETPEHTIKESVEMTSDGTPEITKDSSADENTIPVLPENTKASVAENTTKGITAIENPVNITPIRDDFGNITNSTTEWLDENNAKYYKPIVITSPFKTTGLWFQNIVKRNIPLSKQGGYITFKLLCIESWDSFGAVNNTNVGESVKIIFNNVTLIDFNRNHGTNYNISIEKNVSILDKNIKFSFKSNSDFSLWNTNSGRPAIATTWYSQSFNVRIDCPPYAFDNIELVLDGAIDEGWDNESIGISDFVVTQTESTTDEIPENTKETTNEITNQEQPEVTKTGNVEATRLEIPENTAPLIPASSINSNKNIIKKYDTNANNYSLVKCLYFDNFNRENNWKLTSNNSVYNTYITVTTPNYGRLLQFLTHDLYKDYAINPLCSYDIHMDIFFIESWDSENYIIKINGTNAIAISKPHQAALGNLSGTAVIGGINIPWTFESRNDNSNWVCNPEYGNSFYSVSGNVKFKVPKNFGTNIRLGVTTTLDQVITDECAGLGNIYIYETATYTDAADSESIQQLSSELSYAGKPEVTIDKVNKITLNGIPEETTPATTENTKDSTPENTVDSVPENSRLFDCKEYQHCDEIISPESLEKTIDEIPEETQYKNETTVDGVPEATVPGILENTTDSVPEKTTNAVPAVYSNPVAPVTSVAYVPEATTYTPVLVNVEAFSYGFDDTTNRIGGIFRNGVMVNPGFIRGISIAIFDGYGNVTQGGVFDTYISAAEDVRLSNFLSTIDSINNANKTIILVTADDWVTYLSQSSKNKLIHLGFSNSLLNGDGVNDAVFRSSFLGVTRGASSGGWTDIHSAYLGRYTSAINKYTTKFNSGTQTEQTVDAVPEVTSAAIQPVLLTSIVPESTVPLVPEKTTNAVPEKTTNGTIENTAYNMDTVKKNDTSAEYTSPKIPEDTIGGKPEDTIKLSDCDDIEKQCEYTIDEIPEDTIYGTPEITIPEITTDAEAEKVIKPFIPESTNNHIVEGTLDAVPEDTTPGIAEGSVSPIPEGTVPFKAESTVDIPPIPDTTQIKVNETARGSNNQLAGGFLCKVEGLSTVDVRMDPLTVPDQFTIYGVRADGSKAELYNQTWGGSIRNIPLTVSGYTHLQVKVNKDSYIGGTAFNFTIRGDANLVKPGIGTEKTTPQVPEVSQAQVPEVSIPPVPEVTHDEIPEDTTNTPVEDTIEEIQEGTLPPIPESTTPIHILELGSEDYVIHAQTPEITNTFPCDDDMCEETIEGNPENTIKEVPEITTLAIPENSIYAKNEEIQLVEDTRQEIIESNNGVVSNKTSIENTTEVDKRYATKIKDTRGNEDYYSSIEPLPSSYYYIDDTKLSYEEVLNLPYLKDKICIENTIGDSGDSFDISIASPENTRDTIIQHDELTIPEVPETTSEAIAGRIITLGVPENTKYVPCENQRICEDTEPEQEEDTVTIIPGKSIPEIPEDTIPGTPAIFEPYRPERTSDNTLPVYIPEIPENTIPFIPAVNIPEVIEDTTAPVPEITLDATVEDTIPKVPGTFIPLAPEITTPLVPESTSPYIAEIYVATVPENTTPLVPERTSPLVPENTTPLSETTSYTPPVQNATQINLNQTVSGSNNQLAGGFICNVKGLSTVSVYMEPYGVPDQFTIYGIYANNSSTELYNQTWGNSVTRTINFNVSAYDFLQVKVNKDSYVSGTAFNFRINGDATLITVEAGTENTVNVPESTVPMVPESTVPMVPSVTITNYVPETSIPAVPEATTPLAPEITTPQVPETTIPEIPELTDDAQPESTIPYAPEIILIPGTNEVTIDSFPEITKDAVPETTKDGSSSIIFSPEIPENTLPAIPDRVISAYVPEKTSDEIILRPFKSIPEYTIPAIDERTINEVPEDTLPAVPSSVIPKVPEVTTAKVPENTTNQPITDYKTQENTTFAGNSTTYDDFTSFSPVHLGDKSTPPVWTINSTEAYQNVNNSGDAMLLSTKEFNPKYINISFKVPSTVDDDYLGFNFGYKDSQDTYLKLNLAADETNTSNYTHGSNGYGGLVLFQSSKTSSGYFKTRLKESLGFGWKDANVLNSLTMIYNDYTKEFDFLFNGQKKFSIPSASIDVRGKIGPFSISQDNGRFQDLVINESDETTSFNTPEIQTIAEIPEKTVNEIPLKINPAVPPKYISHLVPEVTSLAKPEDTTERINPTFLKKYKPESTRTFTCPSIERVANLENNLDAVIDNKKHLHFIELKQPVGFDNKLIVELHLIYDSMLYFDRDDKISLSFYYYSHNFNTIIIKPINTSNLFITPMDEVLVYEFKLPNDNEMSITPKIGVYASILKNREYDWQPYKELLTVYDKQEIYIPWKLQGNEYNIYYPNTTYSVSLVDSSIIEDSYNGYNPFELLTERDTLNILDKYNNNLVSDITNAFNIIFETEIPSNTLNYFFDLFMNNPGTLDDILKTVQQIGISSGFTLKVDYKDVDKSFFNIDKTKEDMIALASNSAFETDDSKRNKFIQQPKQYMIDVLLNENPRTDIMLQERIDIPFTEYVLAKFNIFGHVQILKDNVDTLLGKTYLRTDLYTQSGKKYGDGNIYRFFNGNIQMLARDTFKFVDIPFIKEDYNIYKLIKPEYSRSKILPVQKLLSKESNKIIPARYSFLNVNNNNNRQLSFELPRFMNTMPYGFKLTYKSPRVNLQKNNLMSNHISLQYDNPFYKEFYELAETSNSGNNITGNQKIYADIVYGEVPFGFIETILYHEPFKHQIEMPDIYNYIKFLFEKIIQYKPTAEILKEIYNEIVRELNTILNDTENENVDIFKNVQKYVINYLSNFNFILLDNINEGIITVNNFYTLLVQKLNTYKDYSVEMFNNDINVINYWTPYKARQEHDNYKDKVKTITLNMNEINIKACLEYLDKNKLLTNHVANIPMDNVITTKDGTIVGYFILYLYYYFPNNPLGFKYRRIPILIQESSNIHKIATDFTTNLTSFKVI